MFAAFIFVFFQDYFCLFIVRKTSMVYTEKNKKVNILNRVNKALMIHLNNLIISICGDERSCSFWADEKALCLKVLRKSLRKS